MPCSKCGKSFLRVGDACLYCKGTDRATISLALVSCSFAIVVGIVLQSVDWFLVCLFLVVVVLFLFEIEVIALAQCPTCAARLRVDERHADSVKCPRCQTQFSRSAVAAQQRVVAAPPPAQPPQPARPKPPPVVADVGPSTAPQPLRRWFYRRGESQGGPVFVDRLRELAVSGEIQSDDFVWQEGMPKWVRARTVKDLWAGVPLPPPPPVTAAMRSRKQSSFAMQFAGAVLFLGGLGGTIFFFNMDTSVEARSVSVMGQTFGGGGQRVNNLGLMDDRRNGITVSLTATVCGFVLAYLGQRRGVRLA